MQARRGSDPAARAASANGPHARLQVPHELRAARFDLDRPGHAADIFPRLGRATGRSTSRRLTAQTSQWICVRNMRRLQALQHIVEHLVAGDRFRQRRRSIFAAVAIHSEARRGTHRQRTYFLGIQRMHDLRHKGPIHNRPAGWQPAPQAGSKSAKTKPSASRNSPAATGIGCWNMGPA